ncbi:MAG: ABC transporter ATP-binding protein [Verrucomicrobiota bacterium]
MTKTTNDPAISIRDLRIDYGTKVAVDGLTLDVAPGEIFGMLGPNGAGKSSTFRVLATLQEPTYGDVEICGVDIAENPEKVRHQMGYMPDLAPVPSDLKLWEFLDMFAASHGLPRMIRKTRIEECLHAVNLTEARNVRCKTLSRGMTQRAVLAKILLHRPKVMILDEPASGMDPFSRKALRESLQELATHGTTVVISSHILSELSDMCTSVAILHQGKLQDHGPVNEVLWRLSGRQTRLRAKIKEGWQKAANLLQEDKDVIDLKENQIAEEVVFQFAGDENAQVALLSKLVSNGCGIATFVAETATLEEVLVNLAASSGDATLRNINDSKT